MTRGWLALLVLLVLLFAGCAAPATPADALLGTYDGLPGAELYAWVEPGEDDVLLRGLMVQNTGTTQWVHIDYHTHAFRFHLLNDAGEELQFRSRHCSENFYDAMGHGEYSEFRYTWDGRIYTELEACRDGEPADYVLAPPGNYTFELSFEFRDHPDESLSVAVPFQWQGREPTDAERAQGVGVEGNRTAEA